MRHQDALRSTLKQLLLQRNVKTVKQLIALHQVPGQFHSKHNIFPFFYILHLILLLCSWVVVTCCFIQSIVIMTWSCSNSSCADVSVPRYVRVNTLKLDVDSALLELQKNYSVFYSKIFMIIKILYRFLCFSWKVSKWIN